MIAYNLESLLNAKIIKKAKQWFAHNLLNVEQFKSIINDYTIQSSKSNLFIKIGAFIFTLIIIAASLGLFSLFYFSASMQSMDSALYGIVTGLIFGSICVFFLENFIQNKKYHNGVDDALLYSALAFVLSIIFASLSKINDSSNKTLLICVIYLPFLIIAAMRYLDRFVTLLALICISFIYFEMLLKFSEVAKWIIPFAFMALAIGLYAFTNKLLSTNSVSYYETCLKVIKAYALILFYISGNYYIIRETSVNYFQFILKENEDIPLALFFYLFTAFVPLYYLYYSLKSKDKLMLLVSLCLITFSVLTFKYYFSLGHPEITLTIAGLIMIAIAYASIKYLKTDKHGITFKEEIDEDSFLKSNAEALIIAQNLQGHHVNSENKFEMGGGQFGGAGSGEQF